MKRIILPLVTCILFTLNSFSQSNELMTNVMGFSWMPDGSALVVSVIRSDRERKQTPSIAIFKYEIKTGDIKLLVKNANGPAVSPDGRFIAYNKMRNGFMGNIDIYQYDFNTKAETPLLTDTLRENSPSWSSDGSKIVYTVMTDREKGRRFAKLSLWVIDLKTKTKKQISLPNEHKHYNPIWEPRGNRITYYLEKGDNHDQIYITDENGSFHTNLTDDETTHNYYPSWMRGEIVYTFHPNQIAVINPETKQKRILEGLVASFVSYNESSNKIAFMPPGSRTSPPDLMIYDLKTKTVSPAISKELLNKLEF